jgi:DNA-binding NarL/FixJ family response regulator
MLQTPASANLLIVEDHPLFFSGFAHMARVLRPEWTLHMAANATEARNCLHRHTPNLALVDVGLPGEDGFALLRSMADFWPDLPAVLISGRDDSAMHVRARACGASGFIAKTAPPDIIVVMLDRVLQGGKAFVEIAPESGMPSLTTRQAEVLVLLAEGCSNKEMRYRLCIAERTVRAHLTELFHLLGASSRMQAVIRGRELGLIG